MGGPRGVLKTLLPAFFCTSFYCVDAQNLVANSSFEEYKELPCELNKSSIQSILFDWFQPLATTTDYWNQNSEPQCYLNPTNVNVFPKTGTGVVGLITAAVIGNFGNVYRVEYQEYVAIKLSAPLIPNKVYHAELYSRAVNTISPVAAFAANNLSLAFSDSLIMESGNGTAPDHLKLKAQIKSEEVIGFEWTKVSGCFTTKKELNYLYIGNFSGIDSTKIVGSIGSENQGYAYNFIDDVKVEELPYDVSPIPEDIELCSKNGSVELNATVNGALSYVWKDGSTGPSKNVSLEDSLYTVDITFPECTYRHTFNLKTIPRIDLGNDTTLCTGESLTLTNKYPGLDLTWWDGSTVSQKSTSTSGIFTASATTEFCALRDSIEVDFLDCPDFIPNVITSNEDGYNESLIFGNIENRIWSLQVFNRWGEEIYEVDEYKNDWTGKGLPDGVYYYRLYSLDLSKAVKGWVRVIRD